MIRADAIDILVDLAGHAAGNRLRVFARRPAPVQCTGWGHAGGTGLDAIDYLFADPVTVPPTARASVREEIVELPAIVAFTPPAPSPPVAPQPGLHRSAPTFGCFNRPWKVGPETIAAWATILEHLPGSRLLLKFAGLDESGAAEGLRVALAARGLDPARLVLRGWTARTAHLEAYGDVDLALDPFPHGGGITALEGLWMGVPMVTLCGERIPGRIGASLLTTLGLPGFVASSVEQYVEMAVRHASHLPGLARLRGTLRPRMAASVLCDERAYCRAVEAAYRAMWRRWCAATVR